MPRNKEETEGLSLLGNKNSLQGHIRTGGT